MRKDRKIEGVPAEFKSQDRDGNDNGINTKSVNTQT